MKVIVVHGSHSGWTERVAGHAAAALRADGHDVTLAAAASAPDPASHEAALVLAGVRAGRWNGDAVAWVNAHADALRGMRLGLATVCLSVQDPGKGSADARAVVEPLLASTGLTPVARVELGGGYDPSLVNLAERLLMKAMQTEPCDLVDPAAAAAFARSVVA